MLDTLYKRIKDSGYKEYSEYPEVQRKVLESIISQFSSLGYRDASNAAITRLMKTEAGRKRLWYDLFQGTLPFPKSRAELIKRLRMQGIVTE